MNVNLFHREARQRRSRHRRELQRIRSAARQRAVALGERVHHQVPSPQRLPAGCELPEGILLVFPPDRACECVSCKAAFRAFEQGTLRMPIEGALPWERK